MIVDMDKELLNDKIPKKIFETIPREKLTFNFISTKKISCDFCREFYQEWLWFPYETKIITNSLVYNVFRGSLEDSNGVKEFLKNIEVKKNDE